MLFRILKKELLKRKGVNIILFLFIVLSTVFLASSVNNILVVTKAVDYFLEYANVPDANVLIKGEDEKSEIEDWLSGQKSLVQDYQYEKFYLIPEKRIQIIKGNTKKKFDSEGNDIYVASLGSTYNKVFDMEGNPFVLNEGEFAMAKPLMEKSNLKEGDQIFVQLDGIQKKLTLKVIMKDAAFGSEMMGMSRIVVNKSEFAKVSESSESIGQFFVTCKEGEVVEKKIVGQGFTSVINIVTRNTYDLIYVFDMILAALLILIGVCLILIALLVLRFTLVFTMEEAYQEIGIMKAIGIREFSIKKLYLVKYLFLVSVGALTGLVISIPISNVMIAGVSENMIMERSNVNLIYNVICAVAVVAIVLLFCYGCTKKLNKISAITAIRGGQTGERYNKRRGMCLFKRSYLPVTLFMGLNDIASHMKRYLILIITFSISFILITIPVNTLNTMESEEMARKFLIDPASSVYVKKIEGKTEEKYETVEELKTGMKRIEREMKEEGYNAKLKSAVIYFMQYAEKEESEKNILTTQMIGEKIDFLEYEKGEAPKLFNEIAFSEPVMKASGWSVGDHVSAEVGGEKQTFVITGSYSDYMQLGKSARLNPQIDCTKEWMFDYWNVMVDMKTDQTQQELVKKLQKALPDYEWSDAQSIVDRNVGGIKQSLNDLLIPMTGMLCFVIMLITILMEKLFIVREKGEISMMKSVGFRNSHIRNWQMMRVICVALVSMIAAIPLSLLSNQWVLRPIFAIMGANIKVQIIPWQVYGVYPAILLFGIILASAIATSSIKKINIRELNNME